MDDMTLDGRLVKHFRNGDYENPACTIQSDFYCRAAGDDCIPVRFEQ